MEKKEKHVGSDILGVNGDSRVVILQKEGSAEVLPHLIFSRPIYS